MSFVRVKDLLEMGKKNNACVLAFDAADGNMIKSVIKGAEAAGKPVMVMLYPGMRNIMPFGVFAETTKYYAERASVPVGLHLDHCSDFDMIMEAIHEGFSSVMADGSVLPFEENVALTKKVADYAHCYGITVEGELGKLVGEEGNFKVEGDPESAQTDPDQAKEFVERTGIDCIAVSIGTQHGVYVAAPHLNIERLKKIHDVVDVPIVLHGGSGTPKEQVQEAIRNGIRKINIATDVLIAVANSFEDMKQKPDFKYNTGMFVNSQACAREFIKGKMREFALMD